MNLHAAGFDEPVSKTLATAAVDKLLHNAHACTPPDDPWREGRPAQIRSVFHALRQEPDPCATGKTTRHRLNRGDGTRELHAAADRRRPTLSTEHG